MVNQTHYQSFKCYNVRCLCRTIPCDYLPCYTAFGRMQSCKEQSPPRMAASCRQSTGKRVHTVHQVSSVDRRNRSLIERQPMLSATDNTLCIQSNTLQLNLDYLTMHLSTKFHHSMFNR